ncbi:MAG: cobyric acid synthase [Halobacteriales archaeon]
MTHTILVAGTASHVGKSTIVAGLCRRLARQGTAVAPFKAQNMSNNARAVLTPDGEWGEIGVSQFVQARAATVTPTTDMNPVLLKPRGEGESQLVIDGEAIGHYEPGAYYRDHWDHAQQAARDAYERLAAKQDVIIAEGAGSIAEINLHDRDLANIETARFADASILLVGDIERGGVFASLYGTLELMPADLRDRVEGILITKFRGDDALLEPGIEELEARTDVPVLDVIPYDDPGLPEEDSVALPSTEERTVIGTDEMPSEAAVTIGVPRLPRISNFTDLAPLARVPGVRVAYVPLDTGLADVDAVVIPGTKNTVDDLLVLQDAGFDDILTDFEGPIVGICGGYQMLGERITNAAIEGTGDEDVIDGIGLLPVETRFTHRKQVQQMTVEISGSGPIDGARGIVSGYEIHMGRTTPATPVAQPLEEQSVATESVLGTYLHGLFENAPVRDAFLDTVFETADKQRPDRSADIRSPYAAAADQVGDIDLSALC